MEQAYKAYKRKCTHIPYFQANFNLCLGFPLNFDIACLLIWKDLHCRTHTYTHTYWCSLTEKEQSLMKRLPVIQKQQFNNNGKKYKSTKIKCSSCKWVLKLQQTFCCLHCCVKWAQKVFNKIIQYKTIAANMSAPRVSNML